MISKIKSDFTLNLFIHSLEHLAPTFEMVSNLYLSREIGFILE
ncbi:hypothetical protein yaldo0001_15940 [Yersinia aldovae ATCC 35236]|nr:hypothetical protein yaldo0001_15940 [Yersinia aldovae ATCC 35236]